MKKIKQNLKYILPFLFGGLLIILWKTIPKIKAWFVVSSAIKQTNQGNKTTIEIDGSESSVNLDTLASGIYYSFYNSKGNRRFNEDEKTAITNLVSCPKSHINYLSAVYAQKFGKVLKDDLISKLSSSEWDSVKYLFD